MSIIRLFSNKSSTIDDMSKYKLSRYKPKNMINALFHHNIHEDDYVICPLYDENDFQIGVTGSCKYNETYENAVKREINEELGLYHKSNNSYIFVSKGKYKQKLIYTYISPIELLYAKENNIQTVSNIDNPNKKVACIIFGRKHNIVNFMNQESLNWFQNDDNIIGIIAVEVKQLKDML